MKRRLMILMLGLSIGLGVLTGCGAEGEEGEDLNTPGLVQPGEGDEGEGGDD